MMCNTIGRPDSMRATGAGDHSAVQTSAACAASTSTSARMAAWWPVDRADRPGRGTSVVPLRAVKTTAWVGP